MSRAGEIAEKTVDNTIDLAVGQAANLVGDFEEALEQYAAEEVKRVREETIREVTNLFDDYPETDLQSYIRLKILCLLNPKPDSGTKEK